MRALTFINATARSADDLLADLRGCRQFRHVSDDALRAVVRFFFGDIEHSLKEGKRLPGTGTFFAWTQEAFAEALSIHGYSCDTCDTVMTDIAEDKWRVGAERMLHNLDGEVRLMLCSTCSSRFSNYCGRHFQREVRVPWSRDLEQMMLAFLAHEIGVHARRVIAGNPERKRKNVRPAVRQNRDDRTSVPLGSDDAGDSSASRMQSKHSGSVSGEIRQ